MMSWVMPEHESRKDKIIACFQMSRDKRKNSVTDEMSYDDAKKSKLSSSLPAIVASAQGSVMSASSSTQGMNTFTLLTVRVFCEDIVQSNTLEDEVVTPPILQNVLTITASMAS